MDSDKAALEPRKPNKAILEHEHKRKIELQCVMLADELEERGYVCFCAVL